MVNFEFMSFNEFKEFCNHYTMYKMRLFIQFHTNTTFLEELINSVTNITYYSILHMKYLEHKTLHEVSSCIGYTYQYVLKLHSKAIKLLYELYKLKYSS